MQWRSGACDIALAIGVEKLKDTGYGGLPVRTRGTTFDMVGIVGSAPGNFAQLASAYRARHGMSREDLKRAMAHVSVKSHANGAKNPKAHLRKPINKEVVLSAPIDRRTVGRLRLLRRFRRIRVRDRNDSGNRPPARERGFGDRQSAVASVSNGWELQGSGWDGSYLHTTRIAARRAYEEAGVTHPRSQISLMEVHDCFSITELVTMEDLMISEEGRASFDVLDGVFDADGKIPCQIDGGLKCFGHPIGASGLRMIYENYLQLLGRAGPRQVRRAADTRPIAQPRRYAESERQRRRNRRNARSLEIVDRDVFESLKEAIAPLRAGAARPLEDRIAEEDRIPDEVIAEMREMGLFGLSTPTEYGGLGLTCSEETELMAELTWTAAAFRSIVGINLGLGSQAILMDGTPAQRDEWLSKIASGQVITSFCLTEPDSGSDAAASADTRGKRRRRLCAQRDQALHHQCACCIALSGDGPHHGRAPAAKRARQRFSRARAIRPGSPSARRIVKWGKVRRGARMSFSKMCECPRARS